MEPMTDATKQELVGWLKSTAKQGGVMEDAPRMVAEMVALWRVESICLFVFWIAVMIGWTIFIVRLYRKGEFHDDSSAYVLTVMMWILLCIPILITAHSMLMVWMSPRAYVVEQLIELSKCVAGS